VIDAVWDDSFGVAMGDSMHIEVAFEDLDVDAGFGVAFRGVGLTRSASWVQESIWPRSDETVAGAM